MTNDKKSDDNPKNDENSSAAAHQAAKSGVTGRIRDAIQERKKLEAKIVELTEALQRERADITNIRRRHDEQMGSLRNMAKAGVVRELLPAIDNLERSLKHVPKDIAAHDYIKGIQGQKRQSFLLYPYQVRKPAQLQSVR